MDENKKLKIAMAMDAYLPDTDGVANCVDNYCKNACKKADVTVLVPKNRKDWVDNFPYKVRRCKSFRIPIVNYHYGVPAMDKKFLQNMRDAKFDIIHIHSPFNMAKSAIKLAKEQNIPIVATFHTNFRSVFSSIFKLKIITETIVRHIGKTFNMMDEVFVCTPAVEKQARSFGYKGKITYLPFGTDFKKADNVPELRQKANEHYGFSDDEIVMIFVGRVMPLKRIDFILHCLKTVKENGYHFRFFVVGKGMHLETLKKLKMQLGFTDDEVIFTGFIDRELFPVLFGRADLLLFPSLYDNFGLVKVEAAAYSTPGVFINDTPAAYGVTDGQNGFVSEDGREAFANKIIEAIKDKDRLHEIGKNASEELYISWEDCTNILLDRYKKIIEEKKSALPKHVRTAEEKRTVPKNVKKRAVLVKNEQKQSSKKFTDEFVKKENEKYKFAEQTNKTVAKEDAKTVKHEDVTLKYKDLTAVIMAGGKGTRLQSVSGTETPKPLVPIAGIPILERQVNTLKANGVTSFIFTVGHLKEKIKQYFGNGQKFGVRIDYIEENEPLGSGGALFYLKDKIKDDFILLSGDVVFDIDIARMMTFHKSNNALATLFTHPNMHPFDSDLVIADGKGKVLRFDYKGSERNFWYKNSVNAGFFIISPVALKILGDKPVKLNLEHDIISKLIESERVYSYNSPEYIKDVGTPERMSASEKDIVNGIVEARNLKNKQKAVFLDRDGTINKYVGFLRTPDEMSLYPFSAEAIKKLNDNGYLVIVVTNQPVVARGECTFETLNDIHNKMETLLGKEGAYIDDLFFCPHHPKSGFEGEIKELKIDCNCRKPKTGLIDMAVQKYNIDLERSWTVGDFYSDVQLGINAGTNTIKLNTETNGDDKHTPCEPNYYADTLLDAVNIILEKDNER